jgi:hypothetical protein
MFGGSPIRSATLIPSGKEWEFWCINNVRPAFIAKWHRWFNLHHYATLRKEWRHGLAQEIALAHLHPEIPCYVLESWGGVIPNERIFPNKALAKMPRGTYHCGSFDWLVSYALHLKAREIAIFGAELAHESGEPMSAHACLEYWIGYAEGRGCKVAIHDSGLFYNYRLVRDRKRYGYDDWDLLETIK